MGFQLPTWHFSSSGLIAGDKLLFDVGTAGLALDKNTGELLWQNGKGKCGYATPVPFDLDGQPHAAIFGEVSLFAVRVSDGRIAWEFPWKTKHEVNAPDPIVYSDRMFITTGYNRGCALLEFDASEAEKVWESRVMAMQINCPVMWGSYIYGFDENELKCINREDGKEQWGDRSLGKGSLMMSADGRMILMSDDGELVIANADPQKFDVLARAQILPRGRCWTAPVLADGRIYARNAAGDFVCVDVSGK
jgi:outer membrane protein assembly factor BamB